MTKKPDFFKLTDVHYSVEADNATIDILKGVTLTLNRGESVAICGCSGSGKSTLLNIMAGLLTPQKGEVCQQEHVISSLNEKARANWRLQTLAFIFQSFELLDNLTALENIMFPLELKKEKKAKQLGLNYLKEVNLLDRQNHFPATLSGGEKQRVAIARAFALRPLILLADEPTGNLDEQTGESIINLMFDLNKNDTTLIVVTHDKSFAKRASCLYQLQHGILKKE